VGNQTAALAMHAHGEDTIGGEGAAEEGERG
jgi:hypothetical protein